MTYKEARAYIEEVSGYGSILGLDSIRSLLRELSDPQQDLKFIHIAGTNGKGSMLSYISTVLTEAGIRTGRYISPTVKGYLERIQMDGEWIPEEEFASLTDQVRDAAERVTAAGGGHPTVFEVETAIAFLYFKKRAADLVVLETGLGGTLDATNVIANTEAAVFASISRDHMGFLGDTIEEIAGNKAGIIKAGCTVISTGQKPEVQAVLRRSAEELLCPCIFSDTGNIQILESGYLQQKFRDAKGGEYTISLAGRHQAENAAAAAEVIRVLRDKGYDIPETALKDGLSKAQWPGRFTCISQKPLFIIDGAHNEDAAVRLRETAVNNLGGRRLILIMGVFRDKEYEKIAQIMCPLADAVYTVDLPDLVRTLPKEELKKTAQTYCEDVTEADSIESAVIAACRRAGGQDAILAFGSLSYLGEVMKIVEEQNL